MLYLVIETLNKERRTILIAEHNLYWMIYERIYKRYTVARTQKIHEFIKERLNLPWNGKLFYAVFYPILNTLI